MARKSKVIVLDLQGDFTTLKNGWLAVEGTDQAYVEQVRLVTESLIKKGYPFMRPRTGIRRITFPLKNNSAFRVNPNRPHGRFLPKELVDNNPYLN